MELTKKDVFDMVGFIKANYSYAYRDINDDLLKIMMKTWFNSLSRYSKEIVNTAFIKSIETCKMPPTLADILQNINQIKSVNEKSDTELWNELVKAIETTSDCVYYFKFYIIEPNGKTQSENAKDRFEKLWESLPQELKDYCGNKNGLVDLSQSNLDYEKGRFLKSIQSIRQNNETRKSLNPEILKLLNQEKQNYESLIEFNNNQGE